MEFYQLQVEGSLLSFALANKSKCYRQSDVYDMVKTGIWQIGRAYKAKLKLPGNNCKNVIVKVPAKDYVGEMYGEIKRTFILNNQNVLKFVGLLLEANSLPWLMIETGDETLKELLDRKHTIGFETKELIKMAYGVASGMNYLHRAGQIIHGDLAARNIIVYPDNVVKITDFGIHNITHTTDYYYDCNHQIFQLGNRTLLLEVYYSSIRVTIRVCCNLPCPIRWMPPENYPDEKVSGQFTFEGDIWSFGIVLCELWLLGEQPYGNTNVLDIMYHLRSAVPPLRMITLETMPFITQIINNCCSMLKGERPAFSQILTTFRENVHHEMIT